MQAKSTAALFALICTLAMPRRKETLTKGFLPRGLGEEPYFTDAERAALALAEAVTRLADRPDPVPDVIWDEAARHFEEKELAALIIAIASINVWNRLNVTTKQVAGKYPSRQRRKRACKATRSLGKTEDAATRGAAVTAYFAIAKGREDETVGLGRDRWCRFGGCQAGAGARTLGNSAGPFTRPPGDFRKRIRIVKGDLLDKDDIGRFSLARMQYFPPWAPVIPRPMGNSWNLLPPRWRMPWSRTISGASSWYPWRSCQGHAFPPAYLVGRLLFPHHVADAAAMEEILMKSGLDWTILRPPQFIDKPLTGKYRIREGHLQGLVSRFRAQMWPIT